MGSKKNISIMPKSWLRFVSEKSIRRVVQWIYDKGKEYIGSEKLDEII